MAHAGHGYTDTHVEHLDDGSHVMDIKHEDGVSHKRFSKPDLDGVHDALEDHLRHPKNEDKIEEAIHPGLHEKVENVVKAVKGGE